MPLLFHCRYGNCKCLSHNFNGVLQHVWDKHKFDYGFKYICVISGCSSGHKNLQGSMRHAKAKHSWFFDQHTKCFKSLNASQDNKVIGEILLDLRENSKITTTATCIISGKIMDILKLDRKIFVNKIKYSIQENVPNENIDFITDDILN